MKKRKRLLIFSAFLMFSSMMWLLIRLSGTYVVSYSLPLTFTEIPDEIWIDNENRTHNIRIAITSTGFTQLKASFNIQRNSSGLAIPLNELPWRKQNQSSFYINTNSLSYLISDELGISENELNIAEQDVFFRAESTVQKQVGLRFTSQIDYRNGYGQYGKILLEPETVSVTGPAAYVDTITQLPLQANPGNDIFQDISGEAFVLINDTYLKTETSVVNYYIEVQQFTEKSITLPIQKPKKPVLKLFPDKARIHFKVALKDYEMISADSFAIVLDTAGLKKHHQFLRLKARINETDVDLIQISPDRVEYLILKP